MVENLILECPFCKSKVIMVTFSPSFFQAKVSRTSSKTSTKFYKTKEKYEVQANCPNCGKSAKEIEKAFNEGVKDPEKTKKKLKELEKLGLPTIIETKM